MATNGGTVRIAIEADASSFNKSIDKIPSKLKEVEKQTSNIGFGKRVFSELKEAASDASTVIESLGASFASIEWGTATAGATALTGALTGLAKKGVSAADFLESSRVAMSGLAGSAMEGNKAMTIAASFWSNNPFQRTDVTSATKQLVQFGRTTNDLSQDLEILGKVSLSSGVNIEELARNYASVSASGRAMTEDLEMMSDRGVPIYRELGKILNKTQAQVRDFASSGKIDFETFQKAMENAVSADAMAQYEDTLARKMDSYKGAISKIGEALAGYEVIDTGRIDDAGNAIKELVIYSNGLEKSIVGVLASITVALKQSSFIEPLRELGVILGNLITQVLGIEKVVEVGSDGVEKISYHSDRLNKILEVAGKAIKVIVDNQALLIPLLGGTLAFVGNLASNLPVVGAVVNQLKGNLGNITGALISFGKTHPVIASIIAVFGVGLVSAYKNSEDFRKAISRLFSALMEVGKKLLPVVTTLIDAFAQLISSDAVIAVMVAFANTLASVAEVIASVPSDVIVGVVSALLTFKLLNFNPMLGYIAGITALVVLIKEFAPQINRGLKAGIVAIDKFFESVGKFFSDGIKNLKDAGVQLMNGLALGISDGAENVINFMKQLALSINTGFRSMLGIHSPSRVMAENGKYIVLGLANGITDSKSVAQKAMQSLASDILKQIEKVVDNKIDFGILDYNGQYKEWKKISKMFAVGSTEYESAIEKMENARKQANLKIISLQEDYNDTLDDTISKINSSYGIFDSVGSRSSKSASDILKDLSEQVASVQDFASTKELLNGLNLDQGLIDELQAMGIDASDKLATIAQMTSEELASLNDLWTQKQKVSNKAALAQTEKLKNDTLKQASELADGIDEEMVSLSDVGGRLVNNISEGIYGAMPTLESALGQMGSYMKKAAAEMAKTNGSSSTSGSVGSDFTPDTSAFDSDFTKTFEKDLQDKAKGLGERLAPIVAGVFGAIALTKVLPLLSKTGIGKTISGKLGGWFGGLFGKGKVASEAAQAAVQSSSVAQSATTIGQSTTTMSSGMSKASGVLSIIIKGAGAVIAVAVAIAAMAASLRLTYELLKDIDFGKLALQLTAMAAAIAVFGVIAGVVGKFAGYIAGGALALMLVALAQDVIAGGILVAAMALEEAGKHIANIDKGQLLEFVAILGVVDTIIATIAGFAAIGAISAILNDAIAGGLLLAAKWLAEACVYAKKVDKQAIVNFVEVLNEVSKAINEISGWKAFSGAIKSILNDVIVSGIAVAAKNLVFAVKDSRKVSKQDIKDLGDILNEISNWSMGGLLDNLSKVAKSAALVDVTANVGKTSHNLSLIKDFEDWKVDKIGGALEKISNWDFHPKINEETATLLAILAKALNVTAKLLQETPEIEGKRVDNIINSINKFDGLSDSAGEKIRTFAELKDALGNISWIKYILGDVPKDLETRAGYIVSALKKFSALDEKTLAGAAVFQGMGTALGNIDWAKHIFGDVPEDLPSRAESLVNAVNKLGEIKIDESVSEDSLKKISSLIDSIKKTISDTYDSMIKAGNNIVVKFLEGISQKEGDTQKQGQTMSDKFINGLKDKLNDIGNAGRDMQGSLWRAIEDKMQDEWYQGQALGNKLVEGFKSVNTTESGKWAAQGFTSGVASEASAVYNAGIKIANEFLKGVKKKGKEGSPWKTTFQSGAWAGEGLANGIASSRKAVLGEAYSLVDAVTDVMNMDDVSMTPSLDGYNSINGLPMMEMGGSGSRSIEINQTNNNYTNYSMQKLNSDLRWELSKI